MKNKVLKFFVLIMAVVMALSVGVMFVACGENSPYDLKIAVVHKEYGQRWITALARKFEEETGLVVEVEANPNLQSEIPNRLQNGSDDDLFFSHGITWELYAAQGMLEPLDDLYEMEVSDGVTFGSKVLPQFRTAARFNDHYYKVAWTNGTGGLVYNKKMFEDYGWSVPTVYSNPANPTCDPNVGAVGLLELCEVILDDTNGDVKPFVWSSETYYWDYVVFDWWAQLAGVDKIETYTQLGSPEVFNPTTSPEQKEALKAWKNLIADHPEYSMEDCAGKQYTAAQMEFVTGRAAMIPCAQWLESGMMGNYDESTCVMDLMPTPFIDGAKTDENGDPIAVNYSVGSTNSGDSILIPADAPHKDTAKQFLVFMFRDDNLKLFSEETYGVQLAADYSNVTLDDEATDFMKSVYNINANSQKFDLLSSAMPVLEGFLSLDWPIEGVQHYASLVADPNTDIDALYQSNYESIVSRWSEWFE